MNASVIEFIFRNVSKKFVSKATPLYEKGKLMVPVYECTLGFNNSEYFKFGFEISTMEVDVNMFMMENIRFDGGIWPTREFENWIYSLFSSFYIKMQELPNVTEQGDIMYDCHLFFARVFGVPLNQRYFDFEEYNSMLGQFDVLRKLEYGK